MLFRSGFGFNAVEAMALGKPVLISDAGSLPEIIGGKYQIFRKQDVQDLAEKAVLMVQKKYQRKKVRKFLWKDCVERYLKMYHQFLR